MQELNVQPSNPTPYTPVGGTYNNNPVPGAGGLPALSGLTRNVNPMAQELQSQGRGEDSVLVHMTPGEVNSLRGLAQKFGGDLTTNPNTGLPEAGWLGKLLPTIIGLAGAAVGIPTWALAGGTAVGQTALTGDLNKGLMAGLGAWGGASLAGGLGIGEAGKQAAEVAGKTAAEEAAKQSAAKAVGSAGAAGAGVGANAGITAAENAFLTQAGGSAVPGVVTPKVPGFFDKFQAASRIGMPGGIIGKAAPLAAGLGTLGAVSEATAPELAKYEPEEDKWKYEGPYLPMPRRLRPSVTGGGEISFFEDANPYPGYLPAGSTGYAEGGTAEKFDYNKALQTFNAAATDLNQGTTGGLGALDIPIQEFQNQQTLLRELQLNNASTQAQHDAALKSAMSWLDAYRPKTATAAAPAAAAPAAPTPAPQYTGPVANPEAGPSGYGTQALPTMYTPQFTSRPDFMTPKPKEATLGRELYASLPQLTSQFQTSPGAITASRTYPGGSPSERIRAAAKANAAAAPSPMAEVNFGFKTPSAGNPYASDGGMSNFSMDLVNKYLADYGYAPISPVSSGGFGPEVYNAKGGEIRMDDGAFVVDARTVSELGNGSSSAGQELLARLGGRPVKGPGDGVSDSIPANIGGTQEARVARDEVIFPADAVRKLGGAKKLYALMDKAHKARKKAGRGSDTKLAKGLGALA